LTDPRDRLETALASRYKIQRKIGSGGMATVYLAHDVKHKRKVAVKGLRPELAAVLGAERFVQEITTTANLQHPHILPLFDSGEADGFLYYVMPFIDGETLRDKLNRETQLGIEEAVSITTDIADALDYAHRQNVIHRDIKPENILLHDGRPMVVDFGIALAVSAAAGGRMTEVDG
jgi:serine/threonine protein kinase